MCKAFNEKQHSLPDKISWMSLPKKELFEKSWAPAVYAHLYSKLDEQPFYTVFDEQSKAPFFSIRTWLTLEVIKQMQDLTDNELLEKYAFDYLVNYAVGLNTVSESPLFEQGLRYFREGLYQYTLTYPEEEGRLFGQFKQLTQAISRHTSLAPFKQRMDAEGCVTEIKRLGWISIAYEVLQNTARRIPSETRTAPAKEVLSPAYKKRALYWTKPSQAEAVYKQLLCQGREILKSLEALQDAEIRQDIQRVREVITEQRLFTEGHPAAKRQVDDTVNPGSVIDVEKLSDRMVFHSRNDHCVLYADKAANGNIRRETDNGDSQRPKREHRAERLGVGDFEFNKALTVIKRCPAGHVPTGYNPPDKYISANFNPEICKQCLLFFQCPTINFGQSVTIRFSRKQIADWQQQNENAANRTEEG